MIFSHPSAKLCAALDALALDFDRLPWNFRPVRTGDRTELVSQWLGAPEEDIQVVAFRGTRYLEKFHRQDFFFINFVCQNGYEVLSSKYSNHLRLTEGDCYIGQPFSGYALRIESAQEVVMVGLHIKKELFFREYLGTLAADTSLLHFFLAPQTNRFSDEYIRFHFPPDSEIWSLLGLMAREYASKNERAQTLLHSLMGTLTLYLSRKYSETYLQKGNDGTLAARMRLYIEEHSDDVTLGDLALHFGYHPNYISSYLHKKTGKTFLGLVLETRMEKARLLLENTDLTIEAIAEMLGYRYAGNFYRAFRSCFHTTPRDYPKRRAQP